MERRQFLFGPVKSRRLGYSLGVDVVPGPDVPTEGTGGLKVCTLDCVYCQVGRTTLVTVDRKEYCSPLPVLEELEEALEGGLEADFITFSGRGEPTLNSRLGEIIRGVKSLTRIPVAVLTNGTLFYMPQVRADCAAADVVLPSLDAGDERTFRRINRPHGGLSLEMLVSGLCEFRKEFSGLIWLEVFLLEGFNTAPRQLEKIKRIIERIGPDRVQLNTAVRPTAESQLRSVPQWKLRSAAARLGGRCEIVAEVAAEPAGRGSADPRETLLSILSRRPCSIEGIRSALKIDGGEALRLVKSLEAAGEVFTTERDGTVFYGAVK
jgi:wyosine [tRNA(Phe)-imidazoG37] synthetase (radical SAM superfamily)